MSGDIHTREPGAVLRKKMREKSNMIVELSVSARNLVDVEILSKSDPICILYVKENETAWREFGRTEPIMNNLDPDFVKKFNISYYFEQRQNLKFELYDIDHKGGKVVISDFLGEYQCTLGQVVTCLKVEGKLCDNKQLRKGGKKPRGKIIVVAEKQSDAAKEEITMQIQAEISDKVKMIGKASPYLKFSKQGDDGGFVVVDRTATIKKELSPKWNLCTLDVHKLCNGENDRKLRIECFDDRSGDDKLIGECFTTLRDLRGSKTPFSFELISNKKKDKKDSTKQSGTIKIVSLAFENQHNFLEYIHGGTKIKVTVGIDFSKTNGTVNSPESLHHFTNGGPLNQYARAIQTVGEILEDYDSDKKIPAYIFGAKDPQKNEVLNLYPLNGSQSNPDCDGVNEVFIYYYERLNSMELYGPANFTPLINHVYQEAIGCTDGREYHILLILTNGTVADMAETKKKIIQAANLPISIIIVGIGPDDFKAMKDLDEVVSFRGCTASRDIVKFVAFRDFDPQNMASDVIKSNDCLAREVLREVPEQLMSYMRTNKIIPGKPDRHSTLV